MSIWQQPQEKHTRVKTRSATLTVARNSPGILIQKRSRGEANYKKRHGDMPCAPRRKKVKPIAIPVLIIANKYDAYKDLQSVQKKLVCQALRFIAHLNGATLLTVAVREKGAINSLRMQLTQLLFNTQANSNKKVDTSNYEKPLTIPAGSDSFDGILKSPPKACIHARKHTCACIIARTHAHTNTNTCKRMCAHMMHIHQRTTRAFSPGNKCSGLCGGARGL